MLNVFAKAGRAKEAEEFLEDMIQEYWDTIEIRKKQDDGIDNQPQSDRRKLYYPRQPVLPNCISVSTTLKAWAKSGHPEAPERAAALLSRIMNPRDDVYGEVGIIPETSCLNSVLWCWTLSGRPGAGEKAYQCMKDMEVTWKEYLEHRSKNEANFDAENHRHDMDPDHYTYGIIVEAFAKEGNPRRAQEVTNELLELYFHAKNEPSRYSDDEDDSIERYRPTFYMFSSIMDAWNRSDAPYKEENVRSVFHHMNDLYQEGVLERGPDTWMFNHVMGAIVSRINSDKNNINKTENEIQSMADQVKRADEQLQWMKTKWNEGSPQAKPNTWTYTTVICAYLDLARARGKGNADESLQRAEQLMEEAWNTPGVQLSIKTPARVLLELAKNDYWDAAQSWLHRVLDGVEKGAYPRHESPKASLVAGTLLSLFRASSNGSNDIVIKADRLVERICELQGTGHLKEGDTLSHDIMRLLIVMWTRLSNLKGAPERAHEILQYMRQEAFEYGIVNMTPRLDHYMMIVRAFGRSNKPELAESVFRQLVEDCVNNNRLPPSTPRAQPDVEALNLVLEIWSSMGKSTLAFNRAEGLLMDMRKLSFSNDNALSILPDRQSYHLVMVAGSKLHNVATRMSNLLECMKQDSTHGGRTHNPHAYPSIQSYKFLIKSLSKAGMAEQADNYLREACELFQSGRLDGHPSPESFRLVIDAWQRTKPQDPSTDATPARRISNLRNMLGDTSPSSKNATEKARPSLDVNQHIQRLLALQEQILPQGS